MVRSLRLLRFLGLLCLRASLAAESIKFTLDVLERQGQQRVPSGYLGLSMEPLSAADATATDPVFQQLIKNLAVPFDTGQLNIRYQGPAAPGSAPGSFTS